MPHAQTTAVGRVAAIWRYPVKSMLGEEIDAAEVTERGLRGDRAHALVDVETGKVASAKNPRRWPNLFDFRATYADAPLDATSLPPARITLPNGAILTTDQADIDARLSEAVGRPVRLAHTAVDGAIAEGYWPDDDWLAKRDEVFDFRLPPGTFFDEASVHLVTTATLDHLRSLAPSSRIDIRRFRPNVVIETTSDLAGFVEDAWIGRTLTLGNVQLRIDGPCPRCIMITLAQSDLPRDPKVLRAAVQENQENVGVYASVVQSGLVRRDDPVELS